jgi:nucleotide-binding universal stress UspA family protein
MLKVLIAYDGSVQARKAVDCLAWWPDGLLDVTVITALREGPALNDMGDAVDVDPNAHMLAEGRLLELRRMLNEKGIANTCRVAVGDPRDIIIDTAKNEPIDLIIVGSRGLNLASRMLLGSVSSEVTQRAPCPVLLVR